MIERQTVLILGAGASVPYGFPTGVQLQQQIFEIGNDSQRVNKLEPLIRQFGFRASDYVRFKDTLEQASRSTIDAFLSDQEEETQQLGKMLIAYRLIHCEQEVHLSPFRESPDAEASRSPDGRTPWYHYFYNDIMAPGFEDYDANKLAILTYNYDRSIDRFLWRALRAGGHRDIEECKRKFSQVPIVHLHGKMGELPDFPGQTREYATDLSPETLKIAADGIQIVYEVNENNDAFLCARDFLRSAETIVFIGFGYDPLNIRRLFRDMPDVDESEFGQPNTARTICGTAFGLSGPRMDNVRAQFERLGKIDLHDASAMAFLRDNEGVFRK